MTDSSRLAFIDVETTGLNPSANRITEIGVVTVDGTYVTEWTTFVGPRNARSRRDDLTPDASVEREPSAAPCFKDIASDLERRLAGRLLVAHNARFDYAFLKAEFARAGICFHSDVLCSVMLSRRFYPQHTRHDMDSLVARHGLPPATRHRALPDAKLVWAFWQTIQREILPREISQAVATLLSGPVLPADLDPSLIERMPEAPGVYIFHDATDEPFHIGEARNLRLHLIDYFRLDGASAKALSIAHRIKKITWRVTQGIVGAKLHRASLSKEMTRTRDTKDSTLFAWQLVPHQWPIVQLVPIGRRGFKAGVEYFGMFRSERKARNALLRVATRKYLCHGLLGISDTDDAPCLACTGSASRGGCTTKAQRLKHLMKAYVALKPLRIAAWPYSGAIGIRERAECHIFDEWRYVGTARNDAEVHEVLGHAPQEFDTETFSMLSTTLAGLPSSRIVELRELRAKYETDSVHSSE